MGNYIAVDLKVIEVLAPGVARGAGIDPDRALGGLVRLWHRCWSTETASLTRAGVAAVFGAERVDAVIEALVDAEFLEASDGAWRVRGVDRYLRITEARRKGGRMAAGNLKRGTSPGSSAPTVKTAPAQPRLNPGPTPALSPSTEHRAPSTEVLKTAPPKNSAAPRETDVLVADFLELIGKPYVWSGAKDSVAFANLRKAVSLEEIRERWRSALKSPDKWLGVRTVAQLASKWNDLASPPSGDLKAPAPVADWSTAYHGEIDP